MKSKQIRFLVLNAVIAALYVALTYLTRLFHLADFAVQFRISEALNVMALFTPATIPGLTIGCFLANLPSELGPIDWWFGTLATLVAAVAMYLFRNVKIKGFPFLSMLMPAVANGIIVGIELTYITKIYTPTLTGFLVAGSLVALGEIAVLFTLGALFYYRLLKNPRILDLEKLK
ncbi:MAG: QueT transporter family protein [Clostridia bacterium]|nr:QueT transporter family protein [Clostridia bacterium]